MSDNRFVSDLIKSTELEGRPLEVFKTLLTAKRVNIERSHDFEDLSERECQKMLLGLYDAGKIDELVQYSFYRLFQRVGSVQPGNGAKHSFPRCLKGKPEFKWLGNLNNGIQKEAIRGGLKPTIWARGFLSDILEEQFSHLKYAIFSMLRVDKVCSKESLRECEEYVKQINALGLTLQDMRDILTVRKKVSREACKAHPLYKHFRSLENTPVIGYALEDGVSGYTRHGIANISKNVERGAGEDSDGTLYGRIANYTRKSQAAYKAISTQGVPVLSKFKIKLVAPFDNLFDGRMDEKDRILDSEGKNFNTQG